MGGAKSMSYTRQTHIAKRKFKLQQKKANKNKNKKVTKVKTNKKSKQYSNTFVVTQIAVDISPKQCPAHDKHDKTQIQTTARLQRRKHHTQR